MGKLLMIGKVALVIRNRDHHPAHFHVVGPDFDAQVGIDPVVVLAGGPIRKALWTEVHAWATANRALLVAEWNRINPRFPIK